MAPYMISFFEHFSTNPEKKKKILVTVEYFEKRYSVSEAAVQRSSAVKPNIIKLSPHKLHD